MTKVRVRTRRVSVHSGGGLICCAIASIGFGSALAQSTFEFAVDVPTTLSSVTFLPQQVVRRTGSAYSVVASFPSQTSVGALHRRSDGVILFSPTHAVTLGATNYAPNDVIAFDGVNYTLALSGASVGVPNTATIDAILQDLDGSLVVSFDIPVQLSGVWRRPSDLVQYGGDWTTSWDSDAAGVPPGSNLIGAGRALSGQLVVTFDVPTPLGGTTYLPGQLVAWTGTSFMSAAIDPAWPPGSQLRDFSFLPPAGTTPEDAGEGLPLTVTKGALESLELAWGISCAASDDDYEVYEGSLGGTFSDHSPRTCTTAGATTHTTVPASNSTYYLIVPRNRISEGSYGIGVGGNARPQGSAACLPQEVIACE